MKIQIFLTPIFTPFRRVSGLARLGMSTPRPTPKKKVGAIREFQQIVHLQDRTKSR
jgi:hypothetical protein